MLALNFLSIWDFLHWGPYGSEASNDGEGAEWKGKWEVGSDNGEAWGLRINFSYYFSNNRGNAPSI